MTVASGARVRVRAVLAVVVVAALVAVVVVWKPWKAQEAAAQARLAEHDPLWSMAPAAGQLHSRYVVLADAAWVPWASRTTGVGRWYSPGDTDPSSLQRLWTVTARSTGWTALPGPSCSGAFTKPLGRWSALLTLAPDHTKAYFGVSITFPTGAAATSSPCVQ